MNDYRWFRLLVRGIGLYVLVNSAPDFGRAYEAFRALGSGVGVPDSGTANVSLIVYAILDLARPAAGIYLLFFGKVLIRWLLVRDTANRCAACMHDLKGLDSTKCPACGVDVIPATMPVANEPHA